MDKKEIKKKNILFIIISIIAAILIPVAVFHFRENDYDNIDFIVTNLDVNINFDKEGNMLVNEKYHNYYTHNNSVFFKEIAYNKNNSLSNNSDEAYLIEDVVLKVYEDDSVVFNSNTNSNTLSNMVGYSYLNDKDEYGDPIECQNRNYCDMVFYYDKSGIAKQTTFEYEYQINGVITQYKDISEFNWMLVDIQNVKIKNININIKLPENNKSVEDFRLYAHGTSNGTIKMLDNKTINIIVSSLKSNEFVELRLLSPNEVFSLVNLANKTNTNTLETILALEEENITNDKKIIQNNKWALSLFIIFIIALLFQYIFVYYKYDREFDSIYKNEYYRELPNNYSPAIMSYLYNFEGLGNNDLAACILDLIRKKYFILEIIDKNNFNLILNSDIDQKKLSEHEQFLINWFINDIGNNQKVSLENLKTHTSSSTNSINYFKKYKSWYELVKKDASKYDFFDKNIKENKKKSTYLVILNFIFSFIFFIFYSMSNTRANLFFLAIAVASIVVFVNYIAIFNRRSKNGNEEYQKWKGFRKFLLEFGNFKDYQLPSLIIWEHYLVYATSFGIADQVLKQIKLSFPKNVLDNYNSSFSPFFNDDLFITYLLVRNINTINQISRSNTLSNNRNNVRSGNSSFGGGFSSGSSFGGGGGSIGGR